MELFHKQSFIQRNERDGGLGAVDMEPGSTPRTRGRDAGLAEQRVADRLEQLPPMPIENHAKPGEDGNDRDEQEHHLGLS